jgi:hypothetical protein
MKNTVNLGSYRKLERDWADLINANSKVRVEIELKYKGNSARPEAFDIKYWVDGAQRAIELKIENN